MTDKLAEKARALAVTFGSYLYDRGVLIHSGDEQKLTELIEVALAAAYEDAIPVIRHGKDCPNGLQDWMDERVDERGDCSASDCPTVMVVIRERAGRKE